jgi:hypothetical protein
MDVTTYNTKSNCTSFYGQAGPKRRRLGRYIVANPLWPLDELRDLRNLPFGPDPEYSPLDIRALGPHPEDPAAPRFDHVCYLGGLPPEFMAL